MEAIVLCVLDASATVAQQALIGQTSLALTKGEAELFFVGDQTAVPQQSVFALRFRRWADAERFLAGVEALLGTDDRTAARLNILLLRPRAALLGDLPLPPMFP